MDSKRMGRPPKTSREEILAAAARADPLELQLTKLAESLGISVKTVYYYFPTRRALLDALTERAVAVIGLPDLAGAGDWREVLRRTATWTYGVAQAQPGWIADPVAPHGLVLRLIFAVQDRLAAFGFSELDALRAYVLVTHWATSSGEGARRTADQGGMDPANIHRVLDDYAEPEAVERLVEVMSSTTLDAMFDYGLEVILAGIEATAADAGGPSAQPTA